MNTKELVHRIGHWANEYQFCEVTTVSAIIRRWKDVPPNVTKAEEQPQLSVIWQLKSTKGVEAFSWT